MNKDLVFYDIYWDDKPVRDENKKYKLSEKQLIFLRWYMLARIENLVDGASWNDTRIDYIIHENEYTSDHKSFLNQLRERYTIDELKELIVNKIRSGKVDNYEI